MRHLHLFIFPKNCQIISEKITNEFQGNAGINALNTDVDVKMPIIKDKLGIQIAARKSLTEWFQFVTFN